MALESEIPASWKGKWFKFYNGAVFVVWAAPQEWREAKCAKANAYTLKYLSVTSLLLSSDSGVYPSQGIIHFKMAPAQTIISQ